MLDQIFLNGIPLPPTGNHQYVTFMRYGKMIRVPSKESKEYEKAFNNWHAVNKIVLAEARSTIRDWDCPIEFGVVFAFKYERLITKDGRMKKLDASNRIKMLHDLMANALGIDDCMFVSCPIEKVVADTGEEECLIRIRPMELRFLSKVF